MAKIHERPEDNIVRAVVRTLVTMFHPEFRDEPETKVAAQSSLDPDLIAKSDMRWRLPRRRNTNSNAAIHPLANHRSPAIDEHASPDKE